MNDNFRAGLALAASVVLASSICSYSFLHAKKMNQTLTVTGSAKKRIKSDFIIWRAHVTVESTNLADGYAKLTRDVAKVKAFLVAHGVPDDKVAISAVATTLIRPNQKPAANFGSPVPDALAGRIAGYELKQSLEIRSSEIDKITAVSREATELMVQGILLESDDPDYLYTRLGETKVEILAAAGRDARERTQQIAASTGSSVGEMRSGEMGVLQITAADENRVTDYGENDTKSLEKDITAVVHVTFALN
jgi:uncharacterized protein